MISRWKRLPHVLAASIFGTALIVGCSRDDNGTNTGGVSTGVASDTGRARSPSGVTPGPGVPSETTRQSPRTGTDARESTR